MPYSPQQQNTQAQSIMQSHQMLMQALTALSNNLTEGKERDKAAAKESNLYGKLIETEFPDQADASKAWSLEEKKGYVMGQHAKTALQEAANKFQQQKAMSQAMKEAMPKGKYGTGDEAMMLTGPQPQAQPGDLVSAMMKNPGSEETTTGRSVLTSWLRSNNVADRGAPEGSTVNGVPTIFNRHTGQFQIDPAYKIDAAADAKANAKGAAPTPGEGPKLDKTGKFYWDTHLNTWKPIAGMQKPAGRSLFDSAPGAAAPAEGSFQTLDDVVNAHKTGKLSRDQAAKILTEQFGVEP